MARDLDIFTEQELVAAYIWMKHIEKGAPGSLTDRAADRVRNALGQPRLSELISIVNEHSELIKRIVGRSGRGNNG